MRQAQRHQVLRQDLEVVGDAVDLGLFRHRDRGVGRRQPEQAPHERQLFVVGSAHGELLRHLEVGHATKQQIARLREPDHHDGLVGGEPALASNHGLHGGGLFGADLLIGVRDPAEQVGKARQMAGPRRLEMLQCVNEVAQRRVRRLVGRCGTETQPAADCIERHTAVYSQRNTRADTAAQTTNTSASTATSPAWTIQPSPRQMPCRSDTA